MSLKANTFTSFLGNPLNTHNFTVVIPALSDIQILVASTNFPTEQLQEYILWFQGERIKFPSLPTNSGNWTCTMPEGELAKVNNTFNSYMRKVYKQDTGALMFWAFVDKFDIEVYARGLRGTVTDANNYTDAPVLGVKMVGCFLKGRQDVNLANNAPTTNWVWTLQFSYDYLEWLSDYQGLEPSAAIPFN